MHIHTTFLFLSSHVQKGDILLSINGVSLVGRTHQEAIQTIKSMTPAATIRMELIQVCRYTQQGWMEDGEVRVKTDSLFKVMCIAAKYSH